MTVMTATDVQKKMEEVQEVVRLKRQALLDAGRILYDMEEVNKLLRGTLDWIGQADDAGTVNFAHARLQEYFRKLEDILDENGGI